MAINFPASLDGTSQFGQPSGTSLLTSPDHAVLHDNLSTLGTTLETLLGTASGSNYLGTVSANQTQLGTYVVNATPTANNIPVLDANAALYADGWLPAVGAWTYASASTVNVPSGAATYYRKGDRVKFTQTTVKYFVITAVADTLLTFNVNTDFTVANAAISAIFYSHQASPIGYPDTFNMANRQQISILGNTVTLRGWGWGTGDGTHYYVLSIGVTFGITFAALPVYVASSMIGYKDGSDPTTIGDFGAFSSIFASTEIITTSGFTGAVVSGNLSTAIGNGRRCGFSWIAIGTI